ncbi:MAG TPA: hypothetical protein VJ455_09920 [Ignavibacteria bacterium]|nr:hypothetical protein [Ignavibacteria bacterium]
MRQTILNTIISDIRRISKDNNYNHDAPQASAYYSKLDDVSIAPQINLYCGSEHSTPVEAGLESILKINIFTHIQVNTDVKKEGLLTNEVESWVNDFKLFFTEPSCAGSDVSKISTLWSVAGVTYYFISAVEPYYDRNDNRHTIFLELTVNYILIS